MPYRNPIFLFGEAVCVQTTRSTGQQIGVSMARRCLAHTWQQDRWVPEPSTKWHGSMPWVETRSGKTTSGHSSLNEMFWDLWKPTPVMRGRPLKARSDREPILMGSIQRIKFSSPDDPDTAATTTAAVPSQETTSREHNLSPNGSAWGQQRQKPREHHRLSTGAPPGQRTRTAVSVAGTVPTETTSEITTSPPRAPVERVGNEAGEDSQPNHMRRISALLTEREDTTTSDAVAEARRKHMEKLTKVKDAVIKAPPRTDASTRPLTGRWVGSVHQDGGRQTRMTTWGYLQTDGNEDFLDDDSDDKTSQTLLDDVALTGHVVGIGNCNGAFYQAFFSPSEPRSTFGSRRLQRQKYDLTTCGKPCQHSLDSRLHRERGVLTIRTLSRVPWDCDNHETTIASSTDWGRHRGEHTFWWLDWNRTQDVHLKKTRDKLNMQDAVL